MSGTIGSTANGEARNAPALIPLSPSRPKDSVLADGVEEVEVEAPETDVSVHRQVLNGAEMSMF